MVSVIMEVLLGKTIECLAHSISYARIGIMLLVHAALLLTVNQAFESLGGLSSPMAMVLIIGGQIGIMMFCKILKTSTSREEIIRNHLWFNSIAIL